MSTNPFRQIDFSGNAKLRPVTPPPGRGKPYELHVDTKDIDEGGRRKVSFASDPVDALISPRSYPSSPEVTRSPASPVGEHFSAYFSNLNQALLRSQDYGELEDTGDDDTLRQAAENMARNSSVSNGTGSDSSVRSGKGLDIDSFSQLLLTGHVGDDSRRRSSADRRPGREVKPLAERKNSEPGPGKKKADLDSFLAGMSKGLPQAKKAPLAPLPRGPKRRPSVPSTTKDMDTTETRFPALDENNELRQERIPKSTAPPPPSPRRVRTSNGNPPAPPPVPPPRRSRASSRASLESSQMATIDVRSEISDDI